VATVGSVWPQLARLLEMPGPHGRVAGHGHRTHRVDRHQGCHGQAGDAVDGGGGAKPTLDLASNGPNPGAGIAQRELGSGNLGCLHRQATIGRELAPGLVAAIGEVVEDGPTHGRDAAAVEHRAAAAHGEPAGEPARRVQTEGRATAQHQPVQRLDDVAGIEGRGVDGERRAAANVHCRQHRPLGQDHGDAAPGREVLGVTDGEPGDIGQAVARTRYDHRLSP
jgi:hypothetical protein